MSKILISLPEEMLQSIDTYCGKMFFERSEFIRFCIRKELGTTPPEKKEQNSTHLPKNNSAKTLGWCEGHFEQGKSYERVMTSMEDANGELRVNKKWLCQSCIEKLKKTVEQYGGKISYEEI